MKKIIFLTVLTFCFFNFFSDKNINSLGFSSLSNLSKTSLNSKKEDPPVDLNRTDIEYVEVSIDLNGMNPQIPDGFRYKLLKTNILKESSRRVLQDFISLSIIGSFGLFDDVYNESLRPVNIRRNFDLFYNFYHKHLCSVKKKHALKRIPKLPPGRGVLDMPGRNRSFKRSSPFYTPLEALVYIQSLRSMRAVSLTYVFVRGGNFGFSHIDKSDRTVYINVDYFNWKKTFNENYDESKKVFEKSFIDIVKSLNKDFEKKDREEREKKRQDRKDRQEQNEIQKKKRNEKREKIIRSLPDNCGPFVLANREPFQEFEFMKVLLKDGEFLINENNFRGSSYDYDAKEKMRCTINSILVAFSNEPSFKEILRKANEEITIYLTSGFHKGNANNPPGTPAFADFSDGKFKLKISEFLVMDEENKPFLKWLLYWELLKIVSPKQKGDYEKFLEVAGVHGHINGVVDKLVYLECEDILVWRYSESIFEKYRDKEINEQDFENWVNWQKISRSA